MAGRAPLSPPDQGLCQRSGWRKTAPAGGWRPPARLRHAGPLARQPEQAPAARGRSASACRRSEATPPQHGPRTVPVPWPLPAQAGAAGAAAQKPPLCRLLRCRRAGLAAADTWRRRAAAAVAAAAAAGHLAVPEWLVFAAGFAGALVDALAAGAAPNEVVGWQAVAQQLPWAEARRMDSM